MKAIGAWISFAACCAGAVLVGIEQGWMTGLGIFLIVFSLAPSSSDDRLNMKEKSDV